MRSFFFAMAAILTLFGGLSFEDMTPNGVMIVYVMVAILALLGEVCPNTKAQ